MGSDGTKAICAALRDYPSLKTLDLSHNRIDHVGAEAVGALLQLVAEPAAAAGAGAAAASPARAAATSAAAGSAAAAAAPPPPSPGSSATAMEVDSVPPNPARLEVLDLSLNPLGETGIVALANGLQRNFVLQRLTLQYVNEQPVAAEGRLEPFPLTPLLTGNGLRELDMCHNFIAACGYNVDNLREALGTNAPLRHLNLRRCCIGGWRRARAIARGLAANTTLTSIDLGYNGLGAAAAQSGMPPASLAQLLAGDAGTLSLAVGALCQALRENRHLKHVGLAHNCLGDSGGCAVLHSALVGGSVTELDLRSNGLSIGALHCMSSALASRGVRWLPALPAALPGLGDADAAQPPQLPRTPPLQPQGGAHVTCAQILCQAPWRAAGPSSVRVDLRQNCSLELLMTTLDVPPVGLSLDESAVSQAVTAPEFRETPISLDVVGATKPPFGSPPPAMPPPDAPAAGGGARGGTRRQLVEGPGGAWPFVGSGAAVCPYYMCRQEEINPSMRRILVDWLIELYEELQLPTEVLLHGVHHVDAFLSSQVVQKEKLQLVGAVALMVASNSFCKLPTQDGERVDAERALASAEDIVYWTDNTYSNDDVHTMEARLLQGGLSAFAGPTSAFESPLDFLCTFCAAAPLHDTTASIALELLVLSTREYPLLQLHPCLLAACCLYVAVRNSPLGTNTWDDTLSSCCGYTREVLAEHADRQLAFCRDKEICCRSIASGNRTKTIRVTLLH